MKLRLIVQKGSLAGRQYQLEQGWLLLGRGEDCALRFDHQVEPMVSGRHAMILMQPDGIDIVDQGSTNGVYVNKARVQQARLNSGDLIELGWAGPQLQVIIEQLVVAPPPVWQPQSPAPSPQAFAPPPQSAMPPPPPPYNAPGNPAFNPPVNAPVASFSPAPVAPSSPESFRHISGSLGMYNPDRDQDRPTNSAVKFLTLGAGLMIALMIAGLTVLELGLVTAITGTVVAFIPAVFYVTILLWLDRYDPEPAWLLAGAFAWGGLIAIFVSLIVNTIFGVIAGDTLSAVISAPIIEEATKGLGVLLIALMFRKEFDSVVDGIVYAGVVALGFATVENISYYGRSLLLGGADGLAGTFFARAILSPFAHVLFTSMTGIGLGLARESHRKNVRILAPLVGYGAAMLLHALWNLVASIRGGFFLVVYLIVWVPLFMGFAGAALYLMRREGRILKEMLATEVGRGLITEDQLEIASSAVKRVSWLASAFGNGALFKERKQFLRAVAKLGLCHWHARRAAQAQTQTQSFTRIPKLQAEVLSLRDRVG